MQQRVRYRWLLGLVVGLGLGLVVLAAGGCRSENPAQMLETARFEELQFNEPHAREIYERIVARFPDSPQAEEARVRLAELDAEAD